MKKLMLLAVPVVGVIVACDKAESIATVEAVKPIPTAYTTPSNLCSTNSKMGAVDGTSFWPAATLLPFQEANCSLNQLMVNNFLYLVGDDGAGHPRFMSYSPWYELFPGAGEPNWSGSYAPLSYAHMATDSNQEQAGNDFKLLDVNNGVTSYDLRVNKTFFDYVKENGLYTQKGLQLVQASYNANDKTGGIWLPPNSPTQTGVSSVEYKTSWRFYGVSSDKLCPADIMHCETDDKGYSWGLVGLHLVQKTVNHGEFVWASFEHVGNSPDCSPGNASPIAQNPTDPVNPGQIINLNRAITGISEQTGWNYFNYSGYKATGGDGRSCTIPTSSSQNARCLTNPTKGDGDWRAVNVCRTEALPTADATSCAGVDTTDNLLTSACLNKSVLDNFPTTLASKWKYYQLIGMEWISDLGSYSNGGPLQGCFALKDGSGNIMNCPDGKYSPIGGYGPQGTVHLANSTIETWMQYGISVDMGPGKKPVVALDCFGCHQPPTASFNGKAYQGDFSHLFNRVTREE